MADSGRIREMKRWIHILILCLLLTTATFSTAPLAYSATTTLQSSLAGRQPVFENFTVNIDLFHWINHHHHPALDQVFCMVAYTGSGWAMIPILLLTLRFRRQYLAPLLIAVAIETAAVALCKSLVVQPRPATLLGAGDVHLLRALYWGSFPSGDTAMAAAVSTAMMKGERRGVLLCLYGAYPLLIAYERLYIGVHFPLDIVVGIVFGVIPALAAHRLVAERLPKLT